MVLVVLCDSECIVILPHRGVDDRIDHVLLVSSALDGSRKVERGRQVLRGV